MLKNYHAGVLLLALLLLAAAPAGAVADPSAPRDTVRVKGKRVVIEFGDDGRLYVDGRDVGEAEDDDEVYVFRVDRDDDGSDLVVHVNPAHGRFFPGAVRAPGARAFHWDGDPGATFEFFDAPARRRLERDLAPLRDRLDGMEMPHVWMADRLRENAEVAELEQEARGLARDARRADGSERQRLEQELRTKLGTIFDRKMEVRREQTERLEKELADARSSYQTRERARAEMIDRRLRELLGEDDALDW